MEKEIRIPNADGKSIQITTLDERWYGFETKNLAGLPAYEYDPSITWVGSYYPKGTQYLKWLAKQGWDDAELIKKEAGSRGTIVHHAFEKLMYEKELRMDALIKDRDGKERQMTPDEYYCVITANQAYEAMGCPKPLLVERTLRSKVHGYAGTLDYYFEMPNGKFTVLDLKTSQQIWPSHKLQLSALREALIEEGLQVDSMMVLQAGYTYNKNQHWKLTEVDNVFDLFLSAKKIWAYENDGSVPFQRDYPLVIKLATATTPPATKATGTKAKAIKKNGTV